MTYNDFLNQLTSPITSFINWLSMVADSLIHNYIFITFIGITLFIGLVYFLYNLIRDFFDKRNHDIERYLDRYNDYKLYQKVRGDFISKEPSLYFDNLYKDYTFKKSVQKLYSDLDQADNDDDKIFRHWKDKHTGQPLSKAEQKELDDIINNF